VSFNDEVILKDINFHLHCGELVAILGPNGAGKSTFFKALLGEVKYSGDVLFMNEAGEKIKPKFGYVPQKLDFEITSPISVLDCLLASTPSSLFVRNKKKACLDVLEQTNSLSLKDKLLSNLSGGEMQRVLLARILLSKPNVILLDEPTSGMDAASELLFWQIVNEVKKTQDIAILVITHNFNQAHKYADKVILLNKEIISSGPTDKILFTDEFKELFL